MKVSIKNPDFRYIRDKATEAGLKFHDYVSLMLASIEAKDNEIEELKTKLKKLNKLKKSKKKQTKEDK